MAYCDDYENVFKSVATIFDSAVSISKGAFVVLALPTERLGIWQKITCWPEFFFESVVHILTYYLINVVLCGKVSGS